MGQVCQDWIRLECRVEMLSGVGHVLEEGIFWIVLSDFALAKVGRDPWKVLEGITIETL